MDHFLLDNSSQRQPEIVSLLGLAVYDGGNWQEFPQRLGYDLEFYKLVSETEDLGDGNHISHQLFFSILQEWLFFGSLIEIFHILGLRVSRNDFVMQRDGCMTLYTGKFARLFHLLMEERTRTQLPATSELSENIDLGVLKDVLLSENDPDVAKHKKSKILESVSPEEFLQALAMDVDTLRLQERYHQLAKAAKGDLETQASLDKIVSILDTATAFLDNADRFLEGSGLQEIAESAHMLCCILILESLQTLTETILQRPIPGFTFGMLVYSRAVTKRIQVSGLCTTKRKSLVSPSRCYVASTLKRPTRNNHLNCTPKSCQVVFADFSKLPMHRNGCSQNCVRVDLGLDATTKLRGFLDAGSFGVAERQLDDHNISMWQLVDSGATTNGYIVFSHVWSHGLGNESANSLPACQMEYLSRLCSEIGLDVSAFWIDTLLVPLEPDLRRRTISKMASIYRGARAMIVIDHDLGTVSGVRTHRALQIWLCDWVTRLWTFQEAWMVLYKTSFAFKDRLVSIYELSQGLFHLNTLLEILAGPPHPVKLGKSLDWSPGDAAKHEDDKRADLMELAQSLQMRTTTRLSDEVICLGTMLGFDVTQLSHRPRQEELYHLMSSSIPMELMFVQGPRLGTEGFRWAPRTLLGIKAVAPGSLVGSTPTVLGPKGIRMVKNVLFAVGRLSIRKGRRPIIHVESLTPGKDGISLSTLKIGQDTQEEDDVDAQELGDAAIVCAVWPQSITEIFGASHVRGFVTPAVIVTGIHGDSRHGKCARFVMMVMVIFQGSPMDAYFDPFPVTEAKLEKSCTLWID